MLGGSLDGREVWGRMDTGICMAESLPCSPETITTLLIGYTPIQNKGFPDSSVFKASACNAGDPSLISESGRSLGERISYPLC